MSANDWAALVVSIFSIVGGFAVFVKWLVKHYLFELKNNGGSSLKDSVDRLETRVDKIYEILCERE